MPAFARDNAQLVLTGLLVFGDKPPFEKVRAEEHESVAGTFGLLFFQNWLGINADGRGILGVWVDKFLRLRVDWRVGG
jgi:hypothetical protein